MSTIVADSASAESTTDGKYTFGAGGGVTYDNETSVIGGKNVWDVKVTATIAGIKYTEVANSLCNSGGSAIVVNDGTYTGSMTVKATDANGNPVDVTHDEF